MKTFKDLEFRLYPNMDGVEAKLFFDNGYGISIIRFKLPGVSLVNSLPVYGSYTSNENEWEAAILTGTKEDWHLCYNTAITEDVLGHLSEDDVTELMKKIQELT